MVPDVVCHGSLSPTWPSLYTPTANPLPTNLPSTHPLTHPLTQSPTHCHLPRRFGVILFEVLNRKLMLVDEIKDDPRKDAQDYAERVARGFRPEIPWRWPSQLVELIQACWHQVCEQGQKCGEKVWGTSVGRQVWEDECGVTVWEG